MGTQLCPADSTGEHMWGPSDLLLGWALLRILFPLGSSDNPQECPSIPRQVSSCRGDGFS